MHVWCHYEFRITNMKFALVTRGSNHFQRDFEWDLRQAIFKLILVIDCWNCAQTNVMGAYWSVYIGSDNYLNQCSQRSVSPYDVNGSQRLKIGRPYHQLINSYYNNVIMSAMAPQITDFMVLFSAVYSDADQRKYQSSASLAFVRGIHRWPVYDPQKRPVMRKNLMTSLWSIRDSWTWISGSRLRTMIN